MVTTYFIPARKYLGQFWPTELLGRPPSLDFLERVWLEPPDITTRPSLVIQTALLFETELSIGLPGLDGVKLVLAPSGSYTAFRLEFRAEPTPTFRLVDVPVALRLDASILRPARRAGGAAGASGAAGGGAAGAGGAGGAAAWAPDPTARFTDITLGQISLSIDTDGNFNVEGGVRISLPPSFIGETGVVIEAPEIGLYLDGSHPPPGKPSGWKGLYISRASLYLPGDLAATVGNLSVREAYIGNGGFSGTVADTWSPPLRATLGGMNLSLRSASLTFVQNSLAASALEGTLNLPFFERPVDVTVGLSLDGGFTVRLSSARGLATLTKEGVLELKVESLGFAVAQGVFTATLAGSVKPLLGGLNWPEFKVDRLSIDSEGKVQIDGGWLNLREQYALDFFGFRFEITKMGFGQTDDGGNWIGFSGGLKLVDGMPAGASVEGLKAIWYPDGDPRAPRLTFEGVGVEFEIPDVLAFSGKVAYKDLPGGVHRFDGDIKLALKSLDLEIDAKLVFGTQERPGEGTTTFFAIYLAAELPAGIPLFTTGLSIYGLAGLFATSMEPNKRPDQQWYQDWYKAEPVGVTDFARKWKVEPGSLALGAGLTLGTLADNGYTFAGRFLMVIIFPGPILMIEGKANLLRPRAALSGRDEPIFRALFVLDARAGSVLFGLDAAYKTGANGQVVDIRGSAEAFFDFNDASKWHLYLGQDKPPEKRILAKFISIVEANAYLMLDADALALGAHVGVKKAWEFGPVALTLEAWLAGDLRLSWQPVYLKGALAFHGKVALTIFSFGLGLSLDSLLAAEVFDPFKIRAELAVAVDLPWPLPDFGVDVTLQWGPRPGRPPLPVPLKEVAVAHLLSTAVWPLPRPALLAPGYDPDRDGFFGTGDPSDRSPDAPPPPPPSVALPIVPLDGRPQLTFARPVHDDALVGVTVDVLAPEAEIVGDPEKGEGPVEVRYGLAEVTLLKWRGDRREWVAVARTAAADRGPNPPGVPRLYGSWAPVPSLPEGRGRATGQTKLWLWSRNPFDFTRRTGREWEEWFTSRYPDYPCLPAPPRERHSHDFEALTPGLTLVGPWPHPEDLDLVISWTPAVTAEIEEVDEPVEGLRHALGLAIRDLPGEDDGSDGGGEFTIVLPAAGADLEVVARDDRGLEVYVTGEDGLRRGPFHGKTTIQVPGGGRARRVTVRGSRELRLFAVRFTTGPSAGESARREEAVRHMIEELARWRGDGEVLEPDATYCLKVITTVSARGRGEFAGSLSSARTPVEYAYFRTAGPPGLGPLSVPIGHPPGTAFASGLDDLTPYVRQTVPPTVAVAGAGGSGAGGSGAGGWGGAQPVLPRPVYRAYDVGVVFQPDTTYVDQMYRMAGRDLGLYLYDSGGCPVRDPSGGLVVLPNLWGRAETLELVRTDEAWVRVVNGSGCLSLDPSRIPRARTLAASLGGAVLDPDAAYEARLAPLLLHDDFSRTLDPWQVIDQGTEGGPSTWSTGSSPASPPAWFARQTSGIRGGLADPADPAKPGTMLVRGDPVWTDYRLAVEARSSTAGAIGVVFRFRDARNHYRFSMDREGRYRRLVRVRGGLCAILAEDRFTHALDRDYQIVVEAIGPELRVYLDGRLIFAVSDGRFPAGRVGLYVWGNPGARFADLRLDNLGPSAPIVYRFGFTTSRFANFVHQAHSYQDETWRTVVSAIAVPDTVLAGAARVAADPLVPPGPPREAEVRAHEALASAIFGSASRGQISGLETIRLERPGGPALGYFIRGSEPVDWRRVSLEVERAAEASGQGAPRSEAPSGDGESPGVVPKDLKLIEASLSAPEQVVVLARAPADLSHHRVEYLAWPGALRPEQGEAMLFEDRFTGQGGLLFEERFGPEALAHYRIQGGTGSGRTGAGGVARWRAETGRILHLAPISDRPVGDPRAKRVLTRKKRATRTMAVTGEPAWRGLRIETLLGSETGGEIGLVFGWSDPTHYCLLLLDPRRGRRVLLRRAGGRTTTLWAQAATFRLGHPYHLVVESVAGHLLGWLDSVLLFRLDEAEGAGGRVGFCCGSGDNAFFDGLRVETLTGPRVLWDWAGSLTTSGLAGVRPATALSPDTWADVGLALRLDGPALDDSVLGGPALKKPAPGSAATATVLVFRYRDADNTYRLSLDEVARRVELVRRLGGRETTLWSSKLTGGPGRPRDLTVFARGARLDGHLDGRPLFSVFDGDGALDRGRVGLLSSGQGGAAAWLVVTDETRRVGQWAIRDETGSGDRSAWALRDGVLSEFSGLGGGTGGPASPDKPGTLVVGGPETLGDFRLDTRLRLAGGSAGVVLRWVDDRNHYRLSIDADRGYRRLVGVTDGVARVLWQTEGRSESGTTQSLVVDALGPRFAAYLDGAKLFDLTDPSPGPARGRVGLWSWRAAGVAFERVEVRQPPREAWALLLEEFTAGHPPAWTAGLGEGRQYLAGDPALTDYVVVARVGTGDDGAVGVFFRYQDQRNHYRFTMDRQRLCRRLVRTVAGVETDLWRDNRVYEAGRAYEVAVVVRGDTLLGYLDGLPLFAVRDAGGTSLRRGRAGLWCWATTEAIFPFLAVYPAALAHDDWLLAEDFVDAFPWRWTFGGEAWEVEGQTLRRLSHATGVATMAVAGEEAWTDYRLTALVYPSAGGETGVLFRYQDGENYYAFTLDGPDGSEGPDGPEGPGGDVRRRLIRRRRGVSTVLWEDTRPAESRGHLLTVDALGDQLTLWADGERLGQVTDPPASGGLERGKVGLRASGEPGATFGPVRVGAPVWARYRAFGTEPRLPAGTRISVETDGASLAAGAERRSAAEPSGVATPRLSATGARIRLVNGMGEVLHERTFLPANAYRAVAGVRVLRGRDGTAFFLFIPPRGPATELAPGARGPATELAPGARGPATELAPGEYRLRFVYRRRPRPDAPTPEIQRQGGSDLPETAVLDVPWRAR